jgi:predicted phage terminase large subunit-like protein
MAINLEYFDLPFRKGFLANLNPRIAGRIFGAVKNVSLANARERFDLFCNYCFVDDRGEAWEVAGFQREWQTAIDQNGHVIIFAPVEHGKTEQISIARVLWELGHNPNKRIAIVSNTHSQAEKIAYSIQQHIEKNTSLREVFPDLKPGQRWRSASFDVAGKPETVKDFSVQALGCFGALLGARLDFIVIDDICDRENTATAQQREKVISWVKSTVLTRLVEGGKVVIIGTAWHKADLLHHFEKLGSPWVTLRYKAFRDDGLPLWRARWSRKRLEEKRKEIGSVEFARQFLNEVIDAENALFQPSWFRVCGSAPLAAEMEGLVRYWDLAATEATKGDPDWTVGVLVGVKGGIYYVLDVCRLRGSPHEVEKAIQGCAERDGRDVVIVIEQEPGASGKSVIDFLQRGVLRGYAVYADKVTGSKITRAQPLAAAAEAGHVYLLRAHWNGALLDELAVFPNGEHDDQVDALAGAVYHVSKYARRSVALGIKLIGAR